MKFSPLVHLSPAAVFLLFFVTANVVESRVGINWCPPEHFITGGICYPCNQCDVNRGFYALRSCTELQDTICVFADDAEEQGSSAVEELATTESARVGTAENAASRKKVVVVPMPWYINLFLIVAVVISCICVMIIAYQAYQHFRSKTFQGNS